jgi:DNA (cytosine-5)-methyltransferase 1
VTLNVFSLFAGIGALELGLERAGMTVVGQVEIDEFCRRVLAMHWPDVPRHDDVRTAANWWLSTERPTVDVICGGFPCQPFSLTGNLRGILDDRWMWPAMAEVIRLLRPRYVVVENVAALLRDTVAFGWLLGDLAELGFDAEWSVLSACSMGAPHRRRRLYLVAYPSGSRWEARRRQTPTLNQDRTEPVRHGWWSNEPAVGRVAYGVTRRVDRITALGNAVVPQLSEHVGRLIVEHDRAVRAA